MKGLGTCTRLFLIASASAAATAIVTTNFMVPAVAMPVTAPATDEGPPNPPPPPAVAVEDALATRGAPAEIIRRVDNSDMRIAFTFDACATRSQGNGFDRPVLRVLQRERVPATIFTSGRWVEFHPGPMRQLVAEPLIEFANHSYAHPHMDKLTAAQIAAEIDLTEAALGRYGRQSVAFRPPFGDFNDLVLQVARERRLPAVLWDVVSGDPSARTTTSAMIHTVVRDTMPGSIIIFHINGRETKTARALPEIFRQLRAKGFQFVHLSTLLASGRSGPAGDSAVAAPSAPPATSPALPAAPSLPSAPSLLKDDDATMPPSDSEDGLSMNVRRQ